jgi:putative membrane protein
MKSAFILTALFLISYVIYHTTHESTSYGGEGVIRAVYLVILLTHIVLAAAIVPLVLVTFSRALTEKFDKHKRIARITFPLWLYVSITGVVVYLMISPYYA